MSAQTSAVGSAGTGGPAPPTAEFDITATYLRLLESDPDMNMSIAAIEALVEALAVTPITTISETRDLLSKHAQTLKDGIANHIGLSAGTDLFQRYIASSIHQRAASQTADGATTRTELDDFADIKSHLVKNGRVFVQRAKDARSQIARFGRHLIHPGTTVLTNGGSRVVGAVLLAAAAEGVQFKVVYVFDGELAARPGQSVHADARRHHEGLSTILALRKAGVPVATIQSSAVGYSLARGVDMVIVGAEGVVETGGVISRLGTYQIGLLAKSAHKPFYVVAESHKFVRLYPLGQDDLPVYQEVLVFETEEGGAGAGAGAGGVGDDADGKKAGAGGALAKNKPRLPLSAAIDYTPPDLIEALITESGVLTPSGVSEELIKIWY